MNSVVFDSLTSGEDREKFILKDRSVFRGVAVAHPLHKL